MATNPAVLTMIASIKTAVQTALTAKAPRDEILFGLKEVTRSYITAGQGGPTVLVLTPYEEALLAEAESA